MRRIVKSPSNAQLSDALCIDYINRFVLMDLDARIQLFDFKTLYRFETTPGIDSYNMPLYNVQIESPGTTPQNIGPYPVYQGFSPLCSVNGIQIPFYTQRSSFWNLWPNYLQASTPAFIGGGTAGPYTIPLPFFPAIPGHIDMTGIINLYNNAGPIQDPPITDHFLTTIPTTSVYSGVFFTATAEDGSTMVVADSGQFLEGNVNYGLLMVPGAAPFGNVGYGSYSTTSNTINYATGIATVNFPSNVADGTNINAQCYFYEQGIPRAVLFYNNVLTIRPPPDIPYLVELEAYLSPAAFLNSTDALPFAYMAEYIARGAARKLLSDTGDIEQFNFYEPLFREQEQLVWKRSQRIFTSTRTQTIFSGTQGQNGANAIGMGAS
jgi:hypothetical protein